MSIIAAGIGAGAALLGGALSGASGRKQAKEQDARNLAMSKEMAGVNYEYGEKSADNAYQRALGLTEQLRKNNSYEEKVRQAKAAGLSVGQLYGGGGAGGSSSGGSAPQGNGASGMAAPQAAPRPAGMEVAAMTNQIRLAEAEVQRVRNESKLVDAQKEQIEATTEKSKEETKTTQDMRDVQKALVRNQAISQFIENERKEWENTGRNEHEVSMSKDSVTGYTTVIDTRGQFNQQVASEIAETMSRAENNQALAELNTEKKKGYWTELLNATKRADSAGIQAAAVKLAAEWNTGEYTNWKTWADTAVDAVGAVSNVIRAGKP